MRKNFLRAVLILGFACIAQMNVIPLQRTTNAQNPNRPVNFGTDSVEILKLIQNARLERAKRDFNNAKITATNALSLANKANWNSGKALANLEIGNALTDMGKPNEAINNYLLARGNWAESKKNYWRNERLELARQLGFYYQKAKFYDKAVNEFLLANEFASQDQDRHANDEMRAYNLQHSNKTDEAIRIYQDLANVLNNGNSNNSGANIAAEERAIRALDALTLIYIQKAQYNQAQPYAEKLASRIANNAKFAQLYTETLNRLGYINLKQKQNNLALNYYLKALEASKTANNGADATFQSLLNLGYLQTLSQDYPLAIASFESARKIAITNKKPIHEARSLNHIATTYFVSNSQLQMAIDLALEAEKLLADKPDGKNELVDTYMILSQLYQKTNDLEEAQVYERRKINLESQKQKSDQLKQEAVAQTRLEIEQKESELKLLSADEDKKRLEENRSKLEAEKRESELQLRQRELEILKERQARQEADLARQNLEKQRISQQLLLAEQKLTADKKNREILELQKNQEIQRLAIEQKSLKEQEQEKELKLFAADKKIQQQAQEEARQRQKYILYGFGALGAFSLLIGYSFLQKRKDNKRLNKQKQEIEDNLLQLAAANLQIQESNEELEANQEELRQNSEELQATNEYLKSVTVQLGQLSLVASQTDNAVIITDPKGIIQWVNDGFTKITEYQLDEVKGKKPGTFLQGKDTDKETVERMRQKINAKESFTEEILNYTKSGKPYWLQINVTPVKDNAGNLTNFIAIESDVSERIEREAQLLDANRKIQEAMNELKATQASLVQSEKMASLGQMVAGIAHEINTPIGVAYTATTFSKEATDQFLEYLHSGEKLRKSDIEAFVTNALESNSIVYDNLRRAADLVASFKKVSVEQTKDERNTFNLKDFLHDILVSLTPETRKYKINAAIDCPDNIILDSYPSDFSQVCINLVMNSIKHGFDGFTDEDRKKEIKFTCRLSGQNEVEIVYSDNGKGIPAEILPKIFDPFFTTKRNTGGSGLGLNIVYNTIVQKMKGDIKCESIINQQTNFILNLPLTIS